MLTELGLSGATLPDFDWLMEAPSLRNVIMAFTDEELSPAVTHNIPWSQLREWDSATFLRLCTNLEIDFCRQGI